MSSNEKTFNFSNRFQKFGVFIVVQLIENFRMEEIKISNHRVTYTENKLFENTK
jgi:hypothetical protein